MKKLGVVLASLLIVALLVVSISCNGKQTTSTPAPTPTPTASMLPPLIQNGYRYLEDNLNSNLNLICESPDDANLALHKTYYLLNDNFFASCALKSSDPELSAKLMSTIENYGYQHDHYLEILFGNHTIEPTHAVTTEIIKDNYNVYHIKTEKVTGTVMGDYDQYLDKLCYEALWYAYGGNYTEANTLYN